MKREKKSIKKSASFTLVEILVATTLFTFAVLGAFTIFSTTNSFFAKTTALRSTTQASRFFMETVAREVRLAEEVDVLRNVGGYPPVDIGETGEILKIKKKGVEKWYLKDDDKIIVVIDKKMNKSHDVTTSEVKVSGLKLKKISQNGVEIIVTVKEQRVRKAAEGGVITLKTRVYKRRYSQ